MAIFSIEYPRSINDPKTTVAKAVEKTINEPVNALIEPKWLTPYISAHKDDNKTLVSPFVAPKSPIKTKAEFA